ncbi:hypothetical protein JB92DRAFT_3012535 [Gautieria morchelliformis]|nr:hypothetical protein JB92DRAFT_3012535 [Gautieria morchelliformis]
MRGRPSLRFIAIVNMSEVNYELNGDISMYINPHSTLTRNFFENVLCMDQVSERGQTNNAIRVGLGDGHGPDESDLLVFGSLLPSQSTLRMTVARITPPRPPVPVIRKPRPDDPAPRRPPVLEFSKKNITAKRRRVDLDDGVSDEPQAKRGKRDKTIDLKSLMARETMYRLPTASTANAKHAKGKARASGQGPSFKLPSFPGEAHGEDVFGISSSSVCSRTLDSDDLEISNKTIVRKSAVKALAARGMPKEHPEFKELFGWVIRGVGFSLRRKMNAVRVGNDEVERLVDSHVLMYFDGFGGPVGRT